MNAIATTFRNRTHLIVPSGADFHEWAGQLFDKNGGSSDRRVVPFPAVPVPDVKVAQAAQEAAPPVKNRRPARVESWLPSLNWVPPWQDKATLCMCLCLSENTVDAWVRQGLLPPPRKRGGKLMWKWSEVEKYLEGDDPSEELAERIRHATRKASSE